MQYLAPENERVCCICCWSCRCCGRYHCCCKCRCSCRCCSCCHCRCTCPPVLHMRHTHTNAFCLAFVLLASSLRAYNSTTLTIMHAKIKRSHQKMFAFGSELCFRHLTNYRNNNIIATYIQRGYTFSGKRCRKDTEYCCSHHP